MSGKKTRTTRTKKYGEKNDTFRAFGRTFRIKSVEKMLLGRVAYEFFSEEGFDSPEAFIDIWNELHPRKLWSLDQTHFNHEFELVKE